MRLVTNKVLRHQLSEIASDKELRIIRKATVHTILDRHMSDIREANLRQVLIARGCKILKETT